MFDGVFMVLGTGATGCIEDCFLVALRHPYDKLDENFTENTGMYFWQSVVDYLSKNFPGVESGGVRYGQLTMFCEGLSLDIDSIQTSLEDEARGWLLHRVPKLRMICERRLQSRLFLIEAVISHQEKFGAASTRKLVEVHDFFSLLYVCGSCDEPVTIGFPIANGCQSTTAKSFNI